MFHQVSLEALHLFGGPYLLFPFNQNPSHYGGWSGVRSDIALKVYDSSSDGQVKSTNLRNFRGRVYNTDTTIRKKVGGKKLTLYLAKERSQEF